jgi:hypothetical protein
MIRPWDENLNELYYITYQSKHVLYCLLPLDMGAHFTRFQIYEHETS